MTRKAKNNNAFYLRIYDEETLISINELYRTKQFDSMNDLIGRAVRIGIEKLYIDFGVKKALPGRTFEPHVSNEIKINDLLNRVRKIEATNDELFVMLSIIEILVTIVYNVDAAIADGETISSKLMDAGYFSELPKSLQSIKNQLIQKVANRKIKKE